MKEPRRGRRSKDVIAKAFSDGHELKRYPRGIAETVSAVAQYWRSGETVVGVDPSDPEREAIKDFATDPRLIAIFNMLMNTYKGVRATEASVSEQDGLYGLIRTLAKGETTADFHRLRLFAEFVGLPTGLWLLFTELVSEQRRAEEAEAGVDDDGRLAALKKIRSAKRALDYLDKRLCEPEPASFFATYPRGARLPNVDLLREYAEAYARPGIEGERLDRPSGGRSR